MTTTARPGPHPDPAGPARTMGPACVACDFVEAAVRRRIFFTLVDGLGEFWFLRAMQSSGYCLRHARWMVAAGGGSALTAAYLDVVDGWLRRLEDPAGPDPRVGHACYLCETEAWAEGFVLDLLARGDRDYARAQLGSLEPLCLRHLEPLMARVRWNLVPDVARQVASRRDEAAELAEGRLAGGQLAEGRLAEGRLAEGRLADAIHVVAGRDPNEAWRSVRRAGAGSGVPVAASTRAGGAGGAGGAPVHEPSKGWASGTLSMAGLLAELDAGRCPPCTAAAAAARNYLAWLADPAFAPERYRDRDSLCADHLHDAERFAPLAADRGLAGSLEHWHWTARVLTGMAPPPSVRLAERLRAVPGIARMSWASSVLAWWGRARAVAVAVVRWVVRPSQAVDEARQLATRQRSRTCVACEAMVTGTTRSLDLLAALLAGPAGVRSYDETRGLCLRHVNLAWRRLERRERDVILAVAKGRARHVRWDLQEGIRKSSWSVRYEPPGPETTAWQRALVFVLGETVDAAEVLAAEPEAPRRSA